MNRIRSWMSPLDATLAMAEGNVGAIGITTMMLANLRCKSPYGFGYLQESLLHTLDKFDIHGHQIAMLYLDAAHCDVNAACTIVFALRHGILAYHRYQFALQNHGAGINVEELAKRVTERESAIAYTELEAVLDECDPDYDD